MQLALSVADPVTQTLSDVLVEVDDAATVDELASELLRVLRGAPAGAVSSLAARRAGALTGPCRLYLDGEQLDGHQAVRESAVREGSLIGVDEAPASLCEPRGVHDLSITSGPGAGLVHRLSLGEASVGSGASCAAHFEVSELAPHAFTVRVSRDDCTLLPVEGVDLQLEQEPVVEPVAWPDGACLTVGRNLLVLRRSSVPDAALQPSEDGVSLDYNRPPRLLPPIRKTTFELPTEPIAPRGRSLPILAILAPIVMAAVLVMVLGSLRYAIFALMSPIMAIGNWMTGRTGSRKQYAEELATYATRKATVENDAQEALLAERATRRDQAPDPAEVLLIASGPRARLWERRREDPDYLVLRVATADLPSDVVLRDPAEMSHRREVTWSALDAPVTLSLAERGVVGLAGRREVIAPLAAWMTAQTAVLHSPRDVRMYVLTDSASHSEWDWVRWLPHCRPEQRTSSAVLVGTDADSLARRLGELQAELAARASARAGAAGVTALTEPDIVVVLDGARRLRFLPGVVQVLKEGPALGVFSICLDADERLLPEECSAVVVQTGPATVTVRQQRADVVSDARADLVPAPWFDRVARALAPVKDVTDEAGDSALPDGCRLLDVVGFEPPTSEAVAAVWGQGGRTTEAVVGLSMDGPFVIDLRRDGPHALIAGTTGSGKSELLQTLVASLALANRPDAMTFVLIDYKGGSAFKDCEHLPHTVGMVTDLDTHLVERALESLAAELHRREHILAAAGAKDIEDYTDLGVKNTALAPLPRLAIVIDEFASMVRELPEFVAGLVNIAQRGRSLGIHMILATQRPSGVVSPEIRANTNLRIALRVTDKSESTDVIDAPDAASISKSTPGRAYVRLGHSSLVPFQAGRVGGRRPGASGRDVAARAAPWLVPLDWARLGHPVPSRPRQAEAETDAAATDLGALVAAIREASSALQIAKQHSPWLPALPDRLTLDELPAPQEAAGELPTVPYALADLPGQQAQRAEVIDLSSFGHQYVIGSARSGRTQTLRTIAGALARRLSTADVHLYGLDCGSGGLLALSALPHCGAVVQRTQPDRVGRLLGRLVEELTARQELLSSQGFSSLTEQREAVPPQDRLPHVVLLLDRWEGFVSALSELDGGRLLTAMMTLLNEGASAGVHCVVTGDRSLGAYRMAAVTEDKLVLRMADRADYSAVGLSPRTLPETIGDGRGFRPDGAVETQVAVLDGLPTGQGQAAALAAIGAQAAARDAAVPRERRPFRIDVLPAKVGYAQAAAMAVDGGARPPLWALLGVGGDDLDARGPDFAVTPVFVLAGPPKSGRSTALASMARWLSAAGVSVVAVAPRPSPLRDVPGLRGLITSERLTAEELEPLLAPDGPVVLVMDDAQLHKDTPAADLLKAYLRSAGDRSRGLVMGGSAADLAAGYAGWHAEARKARAGALLCPQGLSDGELIGITRLPRSLVGEPVKPGRAHVHLGDGNLITVTVPQAG